MTVDDRLWDVRKLALGDRDGTIDINIAGNRAHSSSILPMLSRHSEAAPSSAYVAVERVDIARLDTVWPDLSTESRTFLKMDVHGADGLVLDGAHDMLNDVVGIQSEIGLVALYDGQPSLSDMLERVEHAGCSLAGLIPGFSDSETGRTLQVDGAFIRDSHAPERPAELFDFSDANH